MCAVHPVSLARSCFASMIFFINPLEMRHLFFLIFKNMNTRRLGDLRECLLPEISVKKSFGFRHKMRNCKD